LSELVLANKPLIIKQLADQRPLAKIALMPGGELFTEYEPSQIFDASSDDSLAFIFSIRT